MIGTIIIYSIIVYGLCNTIVYGNGPFHIFRHMHTLFEKIHPQLNELFSCMICFPWWVGFAFSLFVCFFLGERNITPSSMIMGYGDYWYITVFLDGAFASGINWLIHTTQEALERTNSDGE